MEYPALKRILYDVVTNNMPIENNNNVGYAMYGLFNNSGSNRIRSLLDVIIYYIRIFFNLRKIV